MRRRTKWLLGIPGVLIAAVLLAMAVGLFLPETHTATVSVQITAPPDSVWAAITSIDDFPAWRPGIERVERLPGRAGRPVWRETGTYGTITFEEVAADPPYRLVTRIADEDQPFGGTWTWTLEPEGGGTRVTITEEGEIYNPFFRFMARFVFGYERTMREYLEGLQAHTGT